LAAPTKHPGALAPDSTPETREEAIAMALKWGDEWSHWNEIQQGCVETERAEMATTLTKLADAAEVMRLTALAQVLPTGGVSPV
jgi:hypothetical protein